MANKKFGQLDPAGPLSDSDIIPIEQSGATKRTTQGALKTAMDIPAPYTLPTASNTVLGGVKEGINVFIDADGFISVEGKTPTNVILPNELSGVKAWHDMTDLATVTTDSALRVSLIKDKSGNGFDMLQATSGSRPDFIFKDTANALPTLQIHSARWIGNSVLTLALPYTFYVFTKQNGYAGNGEVLIDFGDGQLNGISHKPSVDGGYSLSLCAESNWQPSRKLFFKDGQYALYRYTLRADGHPVTSINDEPSIGNDSRFSGYSVSGTATIAKLLFGNGGAIDAFIQETILLDHEVTDNEHTGIVNYFLKKYNPQTYIPMIVIGDSIAGGGHASDGAHSWAGIVSGDKGFDLYNYAITTTDTGFGVAFDPNNMNGVYNTIKLNVNRSGWIFISYGTNSSGAVVAAYKDHLEAMIKHFIDINFIPQKIVLVSQLFNPDDSFITTVAGYMATIATDLGCIYAPVYEYGVIHTVPDSLLDNTGHPNDDGHAAMASVILTAIG